MTRYLKRGPIALLMAIAIVLGVAAPAVATIEIDQYAYVYENDAWLTELATCDHDVEYVVLNIGNGTTDDVGHLDEIAQDIMACGIKVYGYVNVWSGGAMRSAYDVDTDVNRWVNPFNSERNNSNRMIDGIFFDQYPSLCGPVETPTNNTANDADYVLRGDSITDYVHDAFAFWSYPTPTVVANVGTAVWGCHPGWEGLTGHPMPDVWVTWENSYDNLASWAGGNMITGTFPTSGSYVDGNSYHSGAFRHIVHGADPGVEMETAIDTAESRGAAGVMVTDDVLSNPFDAQPTYLAGSVSWAANPQGLRLDYWSDFIPGIYSGTDYIGVLRQDRQGASATPRNAFDIIYATIDAACPTGTWGTPNTVKDSNGGADDPASGKVTCAMNLVQDGAGRDPIGVVCTVPSNGTGRELTANDPTNDEADCQDADQSGNYYVDDTYTYILQHEFFKDADQTEQIMIWARDQVEGTGIDAEDSGLDAQCVIGRWDWALPRAFSTCP